MSNSDRDVPSETTISDRLRDVVIAIHKSGKTDDLTVKRVRARVEKELGLDEGFFKTDSSWKGKSQAAIVEAVEKYCSDEPTPKQTPKKAAAKPKPKPAEKKTKATGDSARGVKRKAAAPAKKPKKRRKASSDEESEAELSEPPAEPSDVESELPTKPIRRGKKIVAEDSDEDDGAPTATKRATKPVVADESDDESESPANKTETVPPPGKTGDMSESELSELIDESPAKKPRKKKESAAKAKKEKAPAKPKATATKSKATDGPDEAEIKRLQGWLVKCGIRKVWSRDPELSACDTSKDKIRVLKNMLKDVGMDGKYSNEKAATIKEKREFAKDLAAIQEGELAWGKTTEVTTTGRPSRRAAARPVPQQKVILSDDSDEGGDKDDKESSDDDDDDDDDVQGDSEDDDDKDDDSAADDSD
ncbi:hypothetical protein BKA66DRAFT_574622 [Pyrenochaeta sp. MPI-SDFR-AT-0127]|nr:hypothetical protein BKA66DRAFT_574622 [Pyrenochaeta sp. MPI-SDFR-AT-0127]